MNIDGTNLDLMFFFCSFASMPGSSFQTSGGIQQTKPKSSRCHFGYVGSSVLCCVCFKKWMEPKNSDKLDPTWKKGWNQRVLGKDVKHCLRWFLSFGVWNPCMFVFCWFFFVRSKNHAALQPFSDDCRIEICYHVVVSLPVEKDRGVLFPYSMSCWHVLKHQKRCWWFVCVRLFPAKCLVVYVSPPPRCILTLLRL